MSRSCRVRTGDTVYVKDNSGRFLSVSWWVVQVSWPRQEVTIRSQGGCQTVMALRRLYQFMAEGSVEVRQEEGV